MPSFIILGYVLQILGRRDLFVYLSPPPPSPTHLCVAPKNPILNRVKLCQVMPRYSYDSIIILVTNVILLEFLLEFLSARFVHPCALQLTILSFFNTSYSIRITRLAKANKLFFLATMTSVCSKYLNEQLGVFLKVKL